MVCTAWVRRVTAEPLRLALRVISERECRALQDEAVARKMLEKVNNFIREARQGAALDSSGKAEGHGAGQDKEAPLELEVCCSSPVLWFFHGCVRLER